MSVYLLTEMERVERAERGIEYGWLITKVFDDSIRNNVGVMGPRNISDKAEKILKDAVVKMGRKSTAGITMVPVKRFRMYTDDRDDPDSNYGLVYEGLLWEAEGNDEDCMLLPLQDFGTPNYGCVYIDYYMDGKWVMI